MVLKFPVYLNRHVFLMICENRIVLTASRGMRDVAFILLSLTNRLSEPSLLFPDVICSVFPTNSHFRIFSLKFMVNIHVMSSHDVRKFLIKMVWNF